MSFTRIIYLILIFIASWSTYYLYDKEQTSTIQVAPNLELPAFSGKSLNNISYDESGIRSYQVESTYLEHYSVVGDTHFQNPVLSVFREGHTIEWQVTADRAIMDENQVVTFYNNVVAKNLLPEASFDTMTTDKMVVELPSRDFYSETPVHMIGTFFETEGQAMKGNFGTNNATLFNSVQGRYETLTP
ncbi:LPS export ABC transporter periplasmic protein LptC [Vibrio splendidus]|uniref:LPS export ABC transporter periplasmic protein LptC n=1 Tax=Vibrio splendidus TaxID=29497 RepID=UPI00148C038C|nr:LPS export ABC transporter periplasmic protein LptC [Vibrio splendidus]NOJ05323.1 LPS export ABC transporter periplasmic protein LptC [Vibrio splendidus]